MRFADARVVAQSGVRSHPRLPVPEPNLRLFGRSGLEGLCQRSCSGIASSLWGPISRAPMACVRLEAAEFETIFDLVRIVFGVWDRASLARDLARESGPYRGARSGL